MSAADLTPAAAADAADALWTRIADRVARLADDDWGRPVAGCPGWDVFDLIGHMAGLQTMFGGLPQPKPPAGWVARPDLNPIDTVTETMVAARRGRGVQAQVAEVEQARRSHVEGLRALPDLEGRTMGPTGEMSQRELFRVRMFDLWHHLWDLHDAIGDPLDLVDDSVAARECHGYVADLAPWLYGRRGRAPEGSAVRLVLSGPLEVDRTIAVEGGRARWAPVDAPAAADVLRGPAALFTLVMTSRVAEADAPDLVAEGPEAERLRRTRVF